MPPGPRWRSAMRRRWRWRRCRRAGAAVLAPGARPRDRLAALSLPRPLPAPWWIGSYSSLAHGARHEDAAVDHDLRVLPATSDDRHGAATIDRCRRHPALPARRGGRRVPACGVRAHRLQRPRRLARGRRCRAAPLCAGLARTRRPRAVAAHAAAHAARRAAHAAARRAAPGAGAARGASGWSWSSTCRRRSWTRRRCCARCASTARPCRRCSSARCAATCAASSTWCSSTTGAATCSTGSPTTWATRAGLCRRPRCSARWRSRATSCRRCCTRWRCTATWGSDCRATASSSTSAACCTCSCAACGRAGRRPTALPPACMRSARRCSCWTRCRPCSTHEPVRP